jgi:hypothetical protein
MKKEIRVCNAKIRDLRDQEVIACHLAGKECVSACQTKLPRMPEMLSPETIKSLHIGMAQANAGMVVQRDFTEFANS